MTKTQTGSISFEATGGFTSYAKQNYATLSQIKGQFTTCETGKSTVDKVATVVPDNTDWSLFNGATVTVKFTSANEAMNPTLNVNGSGAKPIRDYKGNELTADAMKWKEGAALAFTYDGTYWRLQDSDLMKRIYSAETAIEQNANDIVLKASKEEAYQFAQPNLVPYFESQPISTTNSYWTFLTNSGTITEQEDGWVRFQYTNNTSKYVRAFETSIALCPSVVPGREYTWLVEYRNNQSTKDSNGNILQMYTVQANDHQFWGGNLSKILDDKSMSANKKDMYLTLSKALNPESGYIRRTKIADTAEDGHWGTNVDATAGCVRWNCRVEVGATVDIEFRISLYEGEYMGPWKPYGGPQLYASQSELKIANDSISAKVSKGDVISEINLTPGEAQIRADKVAIDGTAIFTSISSNIDSAIEDKGYGASYSLSVPLNSANNSITATLYKNGVECTDPVYFEGQYTTNNTTWSSWPAMTGNVTNGSLTATYEATQPGKVRTIKITVYDTASKGKVLATFSGTLPSDLSSAITGAEKAAKEYADNQKIGGRNLWIQRDAVAAYVKSSDGSVTDISETQHQTMRRLIEVEPKETLIEQMWNPNSINNTTNTNRFAYFDADKKFISVVSALRPNGEKYQIQKYTVPANAKYVRFGAIQGLTSYDQSVKIKIEKGDKATDYTAAPEDTEAASWTWYAESSSAATDTAKVATIKPETDNFILEKGQRIGVSFSTTNSAAVASLTLNINNTGAKPIRYTASGGGLGNLPAASYLKANQVYDFLYDGTNWVLQYNYNADTVNRTRWQNVIKAAGTITAGKLICGTANGYQNIGPGVSFDLSYPVLYASATIAAIGGTGDNNYLQINGVNLANTATIQNPAQYATVFLKGKVTGNTFKIDKDPGAVVLTCTIPKSVDDYFYMPLGMFYNSTTNIYFNSSMALWAYIDGKFRAVTPTEIVASQRIYYRSRVSGEVTKPSTWITELNNKFNNTTTVGNSGWSTKVTPISSGKGKDVTKYLYLYTCEQRKRLDGTVDCTAVLLDDSTTIIDGGTIITGSVTANELNADTINASRMLTVGAFQADEQQNILNSEIPFGRNLLSGDAGKPGKWTVSAPTGANGANFVKVESNNGYDVHISFNTVSGYENLNSPAIEVEPNKQYTLSCDYTVNKDYNAATNKSYGISIRTDSGNHSSPDSLTSNSLGQATFKTKACSSSTFWTFTPTVSTIYLCLNGGNINDGQSGLSFDIKNIQLEKGNKVTDWSPAPGNLIQDRVDDVSIGGRNLYAYSKTKYGYYSGTDTTLTNHANARHIDEKFPIEPGESVTFQQWGGYADAGGLTHQIRWLREDGTPISAHNFGALKQTGHVVKTATAPEGTVAFEISCIEMLAVANADSSPNWGNIKVKLEYGNKPTDWSPAPEDLIQDGINLLRDTAAPEKLVANQIDRWGANSQGNANRSLEDITDSPVRGLKKAFRLSNGTSGNSDFGQHVMILTEEDGLDGLYTFSCWARAIGNPAVFQARLYGDTAKRVYTKTVDTAWEKIEVPFFYLQSANTSSVLYMLLGMTGAGSLEFIAPKLERGIHATSWTASPKDVEADIAAAQAAAKAAQKAVQDVQVVADGIANPNLSPFFSHDPKDVHDVTTNPEGYWLAYSNSTTAGWTQLEDGWGHYVYNNTTTSNKYVQATPTHSPVFIAGRQYTILAEIKNFSQNGTGKVYLRCPDPGTTGQFIQTNGQAKVLDTEITADKSEIRIQVLAREVTSAITRLGLCIRTDPGSNAEFDMRISVYESLKAEDTWYAYTGPYKPYVPVKIITATQRIYYRSQVPTAPPAPTTWITETKDQRNKTATIGDTGWSKKVTAIAESPTEEDPNKKYLYLYTCEQQKCYDGTINCTTVLLDDSQAVIDGGSIIANSITANSLDATSINASNMLTVGSFRTDDAETNNKILNSSVQMSGENLLRNTNKFCNSDWVLTRSTIPDPGILRMTPTASANAYAKYKVTYLDYLEYGMGGYTISFDARLADVESTNTASNLNAYVGFNDIGQNLNGTLNGTYDRYTSRSFGSKLTEQWQRFSFNVNVTGGADLTSGAAAALTNGSQLTIHFAALKNNKPVEIRLVKIARGQHEDAGWTPAAFDTELDKLREDPTNMLLDWNAIDGNQQPTLQRIDAKWTRYFSDSSASRTTELFIVTDPPEPNIRLGGRITSTGAQTNNTTKSALTFNVCADVPLIEGETYTLSYWARCTSGTCAHYTQIGTNPYIRKNNSYQYQELNKLTDKWERIVYTFTYTEKACGAVPRVYPGIVFKANTAGVGEVCGFKLVAGANADTALEESSLNLVEWLSHDVADTNYWKAADGRGKLATGTAEGAKQVVNGTNGWGRITLDSTTAAGNQNKNCFMNLQLAKDVLLLQENQQYTWLIEVKIREWQGATSTSHLYARPSIGNATADKLSDSGSIAIEAGGTFRAVVTSKSDFSALTQDTRGYFYVPTGCKADFDVRVSLYEGKYLGAYKPYTMTNKAVATSTQKIYYRTKKVTAAPPAPTTWITATGQVRNKDAVQGDAGWTKKVTSIATSPTETDPNKKYLYLYTCEQTKMADGKVVNSAVLLDDSTTVIDGGTIVTGSVTANQIAAKTITADEIAANAITTEKIKAGAITADKLAVGAILIGGKNLLKATPKEYSPTKYCGARLNLTENLVKGDQYTLQVWGTLTHSTKTPVINAYWGGGTVSLGAMTEKSPGYWLLTFTAPNHSHTSTANAWICLFNTVPEVSGATYSWDLTKWQLEHGNKPTDWTPAPEDIEAAITTVQTTANNAQSAANGAQSTANNAAKTATNYIYADKNGMRIANADPASAQQRLHLTSSTATFYDSRGAQRISIDSSGKTSKVIVGHPSKSRVQVIDDGIVIFDSNNKQRVSVASGGFYVHDTDGTVVGHLGASEARIGSLTGSAFYINQSSLQAYYMDSNNKRTKYFEVSPTGISYGTNIVASQSYVTNLGYQTADNVNTTIVNRDKAQYGECTNAAEQGIKKVICATFPKNLIKGIRITVNFKNGNTVNEPQLQVGSTDSAKIKFNGSVASIDNPVRWNKGARLTFQYDGECWCLDETAPSYAVEGVLNNGTTTAGNETGKELAALVVNGTTVAVRYSDPNAYTNTLKLNFAGTGAADIYNDNKRTDTDNKLLWSGDTILTFVRSGANWYLTERSDAKTTASNYMDFDSQNGLIIARSNPSTVTNTQNPYVQIKNDGVKIVSDNANAFMDISSSAIKIQRSSTNYALIDTSAIKLQTSNTNYVDISSSAIKLQTKDTNYVNISPSAIKLQTDANHFVDISSTAIKLQASNTSYTSYVDISSGAIKLQTDSNHIVNISSSEIKLQTSSVQNKETYILLTNDYGLEFYKDGKTTSRFGDITVLNNPQSDAYMQLDYHSLQLISQEQTPYLHVSDLRDGTGTAELVDVFRGDGNTKKFTLSIEATKVSRVTVTVNGNDQNQQEGTQWQSIYSNGAYNSIQFKQTAPPIGAMIKVWYKTNKPAMAFTFGQRTEDFNLGAYSFCSGTSVVASGRCSFAQGQLNGAMGTSSHAEGYVTTASGYYSHTEGQSTVARGGAAHAEGYLTKASGYGSHAEGANTQTNNSYSHSEGNLTVANAAYSHAEGHKAITNADYSHAEGYNTITNGICSHAEGCETTTTGNYSHAEGYNTIANGHYSHAEGHDTIANAMYAHAEGQGTIANSDYQTVVGKYNKTCTSLFVVGAGTNVNNKITRKNVLEVDLTGLWVNGAVYSNNVPLTSDIRVKNKIKVLDKNDMINFVKKLKPSKYLKNDKEELGFIAQEVENIDEYGNYLVSKAESDIYGFKDFRLLDYQGLIAPITAALQAALEKIETLEAKVEMLESQPR